MPRTILLPLDPARPARWPLALTEAQLMMRDGGVLHVLNVLPDYGLGPMPEIMGNMMRQAMEQSALPQLREALRLWLSQTLPIAAQVEPHVRMGDPAQAILTLADEIGAGIIVLGLPPAPDPLGEVSQRIVTEATASVFLVRSVTAG
ncbi:MAG: universal stress protein [Roseinatronobacter sp.]